MFFFFFILWYFCTILPASLQMMSVLYHLITVCGIWLDSKRCFHMQNHWLRIIYRYQTLKKKLLSSPYLSTAGANRLKQISNLGGNTDRIASEPWPRIDLVVYNLKKKKDNWPIESVLENHHVWRKRQPIESVPDNHHVLHFAPQRDHPSLNQTIWNWYHLETRTTWNTQIK